MNERIKQLFDQANIPVQRLTGVRNEFCPEKFAKLIAEECADQCDLLLNHKMSSEWARGTHDCSKAIKKHFGVE